MLGPVPRWQVDRAEPTQATLDLASLLDRAGLGRGSGSPGEDTGRLEKATRGPVGDGEGGRKVGDWNTCRTQRKSGRQLDASSWGSRLVLGSEHRWGGGPQAEMASAGHRQTGRGPGLVSTCAVLTGFSPHEHHLRLPNWGQWRPRATASALLKLVGGCAWPSKAEVSQRVPGFLARGGDPLWGGLGSLEKERRAAESSRVAQL